MSVCPVIYTAGWAVFSIGAVDGVDRRCCLLVVWGVEVSPVLSAGGSRCWRMTRNLTISQRRHAHISTDYLTPVMYAAVTMVVHHNLQLFFPSGAVVKFEGCSPDASVNKIKVCPFPFPLPRSFDAHFVLFFDFLRSSSYGLQSAHGCSSPGETLRCVSVCVCAVMFVKCEEWVCVRGEMTESICCGWAGGPSPNLGPC